MHSDNFDNTEYRLGFAPVVLTNVDTAQVTKIIDTQGFDSLTFVFLTGTLTDADATFAVTVAEGNVVDSETSPTSITDTGAVAAGDLLGTTTGASFTFASDLKAIKLGYKGNKRWVAATLTPTNNNSGAAPLACVVALGHPNLAPKTTQSV